MILLGWVIVEVLLLLIVKGIFPTPSAKGDVDSSAFVVFIVTAAWTFLFAVYALGLRP